MDGFLKIFDFKQLIVPLVFAFLLSGCGTPAIDAPQIKPNILWIYVEDISPDLGCYGNELALTPYLDQLAADGVLFTNVVSHGPVCSPVRSAMITGIMPTTIGVHNHHSSRTEASAIYLPDSVKTIPELFKDAGYFTFNHGKDDYNFWYDREDLYEGSYTVHPLYGNSGRKIDWTDRKDPNQPFFGQIQLRGGKHIYGKSFDSLINSEVDPAKVSLPPYYPQDSTLKQEWADYIASHQITDNEVGDILKRLKEDGVLENTVVFFFADHGMRALRHKQFLYDGGLQVPFIMTDFSSENGQVGKVNDALVNLLDLGPTSLSLAGIELPRYLDGKDLLAEDYKPHEFIISVRDRCDFTIDRIRSVRSNKFKYIRNFKTDRALLQPNYRDEWASTKQFRQLFEEGKLNDLQARIFQMPRPSEELYSLVDDPFETINLADSTNFSETLQIYRTILDDWIRQTNDQGQFEESDEGLKYMLGIWGDQAVNPEYDKLRKTFPQLSGSLSEKRSAKPELIEVP